LFLRNSQATSPISFLLGFLLSIEEEIILLTLYAPSVPLATMSRTSWVV
jgi:hypothetical protein